MKTDEELMDRFVAGDRNALAELSDRHRSMVYNISMSMLGNSHGASDATQQVFLKVIRKGRTYRKGNSVKGWICRIAMNQARDMIRRQKMRSFHEAKAAGKQKESGMDVSERVFRKELREAVSGLPNDYRMPLELHYYHGLSYSEAAIALDIPEGTLAAGSGARWVS